MSLWGSRAPWAPGEAWGGAYTQYFTVPHVLPAPESLYPHYCAKMDTLITSHVFPVRNWVPDVRGKEVPCRE